MAEEAVDLAIVGAGPAGLSAACEAARLGLRPVVFEREAEAGGTVRHCGHPGFGMLDFGRLWTGPYYARALRRTSGGLDIRLSHAVTALAPGGHLTVSTPAGERQVRARRVLLACGVRETPRATRLVSGGRPFGVLTTGALQRLVYMEGRVPCRHPVVVGSELVAFSTILTLRHAGVRPVCLVEAGPRSAAPFPAAALARLFYGVALRTGMRVSRIEGLERVEAVIVEGPSGTERIACDAVIFTGGWVPEATLCRLHPMGVDAATGGPAVDATLRTADPAVFAAGNIRYGVRSSGLCAREGRRVARAIVRDLEAGR